MTENEKSVEDYRRNIYLLKTRLAEQEDAVNRLKEEYSPYNLLEDESEFSKLKSKILEGTELQIRKLRWPSWAIKKADWWSIQPGTTTSLILQSKNFWRPARCSPWRLRWCLEQQTRSYSSLFPALTWRRHWERSAVSIHWCRPFGKLGCSVDRSCIERASQ